MRKQTLKRSLSLLMAVVMLLSLLVVPAAAEPAPAEKHGTATVTMKHENKDQNSMCDPMFDAKADITVSGGNAAVKLLVANPVPSFPDQGADGTVKNVKVTYNGVQYDAVSELGTGAMMTAKVDNQLFGLTAGEQYPAQVLTVTLPEAAIAEGALLKTDCFVNVVMNMDVVFRMQLTELVWDAVEPEVKPGTTPEEIMANCSAVIMKDGQPRNEMFRENETSAQVKVQLDPGIEKCYLTLFSYASNTAFDPDASHNIRLGSQFVKNGDLVTIDFNPVNLPLKVGYSVIACLNVPVGPDWYKPVTSQPIKIVDENGQGFQDYDPYPNAFINDTALEAGATKMHISLEADARLFQAAKDKKTSLNVAVRQYPDGSDFDFEAEDQITVYNAFDITEPIVNQEITLTEPLKPGYRVRAVVYWEQSVELHLVKGNDYEAIFNCPDDSVLISGEMEKPAAPVVTIAGAVTPSSKTIAVNTEGEIPAGARLLVKAYAADAQAVLSEGTLVASANAAAAVTLTPAAGSLKTGEKLVAFVLSSGKLLAQSAPVTVGEDAPAPTEDSVVLAGPITVETKSAKVTVTGCEAFKGGYLILATGTAGDTYVDSRTQIANVPFTGAGTYDVAFRENAELTEGQSVMAYVYRYDSVADKTMYKKGNEIIITAGQPEPPAANASVTITDKVITQGDTKVNASAEWDKSLGSQAAYALYQFTGETLDKTTAETLSSGKVYASYPHMIMNVRGLKVDAKLQVVLTIGGHDYLSNVIVVGPSPDWGEPAITLADSTILPDAASISVNVQYDEGYLTLGDAFYCDVTVYQIPGDVSLDKFLENELWENPNVAVRVGQINSRLGDETLGNVSVPVLKGVELLPGNQIVAKLRLPHPEWEGEEKDYLSGAAVVADPNALAAEAVDAKITAIGEVTLESEAAITEARAAYEVLTDAQKALVNNLAVLEAAEAKLAELKAEAMTDVRVTYLSVRSGKMVTKTVKVAADARFLTAEDCAGTMPEGYQFVKSMRITKLFGRSSAIVMIEKIPAVSKDVRVTYMAGGKIVAAKQVTVAADARFLTAEDCVETMPEGYQFVKSMRITKLFGHSSAIVRVEKLG